MALSALVHMSRIRTTILPVSQFHSTSIVVVVATGKFVAQLHNGHKEGDFDSDDGIVDEAFAGSLCH